MAFNFNHYPVSNVEINRFLTHVQNRQGNNGAQIFIDEYGRSFLNQPLWTITIGGNNQVLRRVFVEGLIHARERLAGTTALWILDQVTRDNDPNLINWLNNNELIIAPCINPDGYNYCMSGWLESRQLWRKNMRNGPNYVNSNWGVDLCRNFATPNWAAVTQNQGKRVGDTDYPGPNAFSEPETISLTNYILNGLPNANPALAVAPKTEILYAFDIHSHASLVLTGNAESAPVYEQAVQTNDITPYATTLTYGVQRAYGFYPPPDAEITGTTIDWFNLVYPQASNRRCHCVVVELEANWGTWPNMNAIIELFKQNTGSNFAPPPPLNIATAGQRAYTALKNIMLNGSKFP